MVHGGPYPATSDSRATSVGTYSIYRFVRPVCYQDFPQAALPAELKDENPLGIWRLVDGQFTRDAVLASLGGRRQSVITLEAMSATDMLRIPGARVSRERLQPAHQPCAGKAAQRSKAIDQRHHFAGHSTWAASPARWRRMGRRARTCVPPATISDAYASQKFDCRPWR